MLKLTRAIENVSANSWEELHSSWGFSYLACYLILKLKAIGSNMVISITSEVIEESNIILVLDN